MKSDATSEGPQTISHKKCLKKKIGYLVEEGNRRVVMIAILKY